MASAFVDIAPGAELNELAALYAERIRASIGNPRKLRRFRALKTTVLVVPFDEGDAFTLRFDLGRLTVHDGAIGVPIVTFGGPRELLERIEMLHPWQLLREASARSESPRNKPGSRESVSLLREVWRGELKVYGATRHPRTILRFVDLLRRE